MVSPATPTGDPSRLVLPPEGGLRLDSAEFARLYGPGVFTMSTLYNTHVGVYNKADRIVSIRFRSVIAGLLQKIRLYWQAGSGYSSGTGGRIRITVLPDDGSDEHLPVLNGSPLARTHFTPDLAPNSSQSLLDELTFEQNPLPLPPQLESDLQGVGDDVADHGFSRAFHGYPVNRGDHGVVHQITGCFIQI